MFGSKKVLRKGKTQKIIKATIEIRHHSFKTIVLDNPKIMFGLQKVPRKEKYILMFGCIINK